MDKSGELIESVVKLADAARKGGLLSLEGGNSQQISARGIQLLIDGHDGEVVRGLYGA